MDKLYNISVEFERFTKNFERASEPRVVQIGNSDAAVLQFTDRKGVEHSYSMRQVLGYHVEEA